VPSNLVPLVLIVMNVVYSATAYPAGRLSDRIGRKAVLLISFALYALVYAGFAVSTTSWHIWILLCFYGLYLGLNQGALLAITADQVPSDRRGTAFGLLNLSIGIGLLPASLLGGFLWDQFSPQATFLAGCVFSIAAFFIFALSEKSIKS
jgi:MFS family permease